MTDKLPDWLDPVWVWFLGLVTPLIDSVRDMVAASAGGLFIAYIAYVLLFQDKKGSKGSKKANGSKTSKKKRDQS